MYCPNPDCPDRRPREAPAQYREGTERCPYCGTLLECGAPPPPGDDEDPDSPATAGARIGHEVTVFVAGDPTEASMITGLLEGNGIPCRQRIPGPTGEPAFFSARWAPMPGQRYEIVVTPAAEDAARRLLEDTFGPDLPEPVVSAGPAAGEPSRTADGQSVSGDRGPGILGLLLAMLALTALAVLALHALR